MSSARPGPPSGWDSGKPLAPRSRARGQGPRAERGTAPPLPGGGGGTHQHIAQHEEPAFLGLDDLPPVVVNGFYHVVGPDEVSVSAAEELKSQPRVTRPPRLHPPGRGRGGTGLRGVGAARSRHCFMGAPRSPPRSPPAQFRQRLCQSHSLSLQTVKGSNQHPLGTRCSSAATPPQGGFTCCHPSVPVSDSPG